MRDLSAKRNTENGTDWFCASGLVLSGMFDFWKLCFPFKFRKSSHDEQYTLLSQHSDTTVAWKDAHLAGEDSIDLRPSSEIKERYVGFGIGGAGNMRKLVAFFSWFCCMFPLAWLVCFWRAHVSICIGFSCEMEDWSEWLRKWVTNREIFGEEGWSF